MKDWAKFGAKYTKSYENKGVKMGNLIGQQRTSLKKRGRPARHGVYVAIRGGQIPPEHARVVAKVKGEIARFVKELGGEDGLSATDRVLLLSLEAGLLILELIAKEVRAHGLPKSSLLDVAACYMNSTRRIVDAISAAHPTKPAAKSISEITASYRSQKRKQNEAQS